MFTVQQKIEHLKNLGFKGDLSQIERCYRGEQFDLSDANYQKLLQESKKLCAEFTAMSKYLLNPLLKKDAEERKAEILDTLFPGHGMIFGGGDGLEAVIGMVDVGNMVYINVRNHFANNALVTLNDYVFVASNVNFGSTLPSDGRGQAQPITVGANTWLCANIDVAAGSHIGAKSVLGLGSVVTPASIIRDETLAFGAPCQSYKAITPDYVGKKLDKPFAWTEEEIKFLLAHARKLGVKDDLHDYVRMLNGEDYNCLTPGVGALHDLAHHLCSEYNDRATNDSRRQLILDMLFPIHGKNLTVGKDLYCDIVGATRMGKNVKIGDHVTLAGNIDIGNNVTIGDRVTLQCIGHRVYWEGRLLGYTPDQQPIEMNTSSAIKIRNGIKLRTGTKVKPGVEVRHNTNVDELLIK